MKKSNLAYILFFLCYFSFSQNSNDIVIGKIDSLNSKILNEQRHIWVHVPNGNYQNTSKSEKFPVLYLLDGRNNFHSVVGLIKQLSSINQNTILPKMIIVGITNTNRTRDLTPTKGKLFNGSQISTDSVGGAQFMAFIEKELIPYIDNNYPSEAYKTFVGHSLGGLTVMNTLINQPELFNSYIAIDPSMWWNDRHLLKQIKHTVFNKQYDNRKLFLSMANTAHMDTTSVQKDTTYRTRQLRSILELHSILSHKDHQKYLSYKGKYYENESHSSVALITTYDALHFIFDFYNLEIRDIELADPKVNIVSKIKKHYERLSTEFGRVIKPKLYFIENLANQLMDAQQNHKAESLLKYNTTIYPKNPFTFNRLGDFYILSGNSNKAIESFEKSYNLDGNSYARDKLKVLNQ